MSPFLSVPYPQPAPDITHGSMHHLCSWTFSSHALKNKFLLPITCLSADDTGIDTLSTFTCSSVPILHGRVGAQGAKPRPETFPLAVAQRTRMFRPCRSCSRWPYKMQLLTASGISHLYLEREAALHANTWNRSEQRSWAVTEGPFTPGWLHKSSLDGRWLISSRLGWLPDLSAAPTETTFAAGRLGHHLRLLNPRFAPDGKHGRKRWRQIRPSGVGVRVPVSVRWHVCARPRAGPRLAVFSSGALPTGASSPLTCLICK